MRDDGRELEAGRKLRILKLDLHYGQNGVTPMDVQTAEFELEAEMRRGSNGQGRYAESGGASFCLRRCSSRYW